MNTTNRPTYGIPEPPTFNPNIPKLLNEDRVQADGVLSQIFEQFAENDAAMHEALDAHRHSAAHITSGTLPVARGGTGATTAAGIRNNLGLGNTTGAVPIANGGTGATTAAAARNALGLGNTTGAVPVANGGTGATTAANARVNLAITPANINALISQDGASNDVLSYTTTGVYRLQGPLMNGPAGSDTWATTRSSTLLIWRGRGGSTYAELINNNDGRRWGTPSGFTANSWEPLPTRVVNNLTSSEAHAALSANQGRLLNNRFAQGTWTPTSANTKAYTIEVAPNTRHPVWDRIGNIVNIRATLYIRRDNLTQNRYIILGGLPFNSDANAAQFSGVTSQTIVQNTAGFAASLRHGNSLQVYFRQLENLASIAVAVVPSNGANPRILATNDFPENGILRLNINATYRTL